MKLEKRQTTTLNLKPCSMTSFSHLNEIYYGIACYEQNSQNEYIGEIIITKSSDLSEIKKIPTNGGVFRIYSLPKENSIFAVTTSGDFIFINDKTFDVKVISIPDKPYFTDGCVSTNYLATTDDKGNLHLIDRQTQVFFVCSLDFLFYLIQLLASNNESSSAPFKKSWRFGMSSMVLYMDK